MNESNPVSQASVSARSTRDLLFLMPALIWAGVIFALSHRETIPTAGFNAQLVSSLGHLGAYAVLGALLCGGFLFMGLPRITAAMYAIGVATLYGLIDEFHQSFVSGRHAGPEDLVLDFVGASFAVMVLLKLTLLRKAG